MSNPTLIVSQIGFAAAEISITDLKTKVVTKEKAVLLSLILSDGSPVDALVAGELNDLLRTITEAAAKAAPPVEIDLNALAEVQRAVAAVAETEPAPPDDEPADRQAAGLEPKP